MIENKVAKCRIIKKERADLVKTTKLLNINRWAELLIGKNSVNPWIMPKISGFIFILAVREQKN